MLKKHKMLFELVALKETEHGAISIMESVKLMNDISKISKKHGFEAYCKGYPKEVLDYVPTGKTYHIKTVEDIAKLTPEQFEMFVEDLRNFCRTMQGVDFINSLGIETKTDKGMMRIDSGLHEAKVNITMEATNKL